MMQQTYAYGAPPPWPRDGHHDESTPTITTPGAFTFQPTPESAIVPPVWETAGNCPSCGGPIYSRRDPEKPAEAPEVRRNCALSCSTRQAPKAKPLRKARTKR